MIPIGSWVIKWFFLDHNLAGADFCLNLGDRSRVQIDSPASQENWRVTLVETGLDAMTGCRIKRIEKYIEGDTFLPTYGDGVANVNVRQLVEFHHKHERIGTVTTVQAPGRFGEIEPDGTQVVEFVEKHG